MITNIHLGNFKAFAETQKIPIKPLTLIFGPNSAGKSSLIHGIALANQAIETGDLDVYRTTVGGEAIDLGGFRQYVHRRNKELNVEWTVDLDVSKLTGRIGELLAGVRTISIAFIFGLGKTDETGEQHTQDKQVTQKREEIITMVSEMDAKDQSEMLNMLIQLLNKPRIGTCEITGDGQTLIRASRRGDGLYRFDRLEPDHPILREIFKAIVGVYTTATSISHDDYDGFRDAVSDLLKELSVTIDKFLPRQILKNGVPLDTSSLLLAAIGKGTRKEDLTQATKNSLPFILNELIQGLSAFVESEINRFQYLGPLRSYPPRHIAFSQHDDVNWHAGGGFAWDIVRKDYTIRKKVNAWLGDKDKLSTPYELVIRHLLTVDDLDNAHEEAFNKIEEKLNSEMDELLTPYDVYDEAYAVLQDLKAREATIADVQELNLVDQRSNTIVSHRDVGIGISQVLPVLVGAYASKEKIIAIEQPEIHLHPALQAELGDVFIESALGENKNTYILETHSEYLILRILRRIRETTTGELPQGHPPIKPSDVAVIYAEPTDKGTVLKELRVTEDGEFADKWPDGFFAERTKELF